MRPPSTATLLLLATLSIPAQATADGDELPLVDGEICEPVGAPVIAGEASDTLTNAEIAERLSDAADLGDYVAYHRGLSDLAAGSVDEACDRLEQASRSVLPALALRAQLAHAQCLVAKHDTKRAQSAVRQLMTRYPGLERAQRLYRELYPTRPVPDAQFDELGRKRGSAGSAPRIRWTPPGPGDIADKMVGRGNPRMHPVMRRMSAAKLYMLSGRYADAWRFYSTIPARVLGRDGAIEAAQSALEAGQTDAALKILRPLGESRDERSIYWAGRAEQLADNVDAARSLYERIAQTEPPDYYGVWAAARLRELSGEINRDLLTPVWLDGVPTCPAPTLPTREDALRDLDTLIANHGRVMPWLGRSRQLIERGFFVKATEELRTAHEAFRQAKGNRPRQTGVLRLWRGGRTPPIAGDREVRKARARLGSQGEALIARVARALGDEGLALRVERPGWGDFRSYHRQAWRDLVMRAAARHGVDPDLIWAIMFRESVFNADVVSHARAIGLMQVIPPTGYEIAESRAIEGFDPSQLFEPDRAIDFGAYYLRVLLDRFGGRVPLAIAGYNGGPHNVEKWLNLRGNADLDLFLEQIPFTETHRYVRRVLTSLAIYQSVRSPSRQPLRPTEPPPVAVAPREEDHYPEL